ncbi:TetR/AcrR family transcriptional regulator [Nocardia sp. NPDC051321]|uniref:TetR/AcrR family transcriptional regulator n=1 Tax=Nocardia sp. NPDC051321 TaxID=3364323 RepID=UPI0037B7A4AD
MPKSPTKRRPLTVAALLDAAQEVFAEKGFGASSVPDICARAGLTKGAFYSNFPDKETLFLALFDRHNAATLERVRVVLAESAGQMVGSDPPRLPEPHVERRRWFLISMEFTLHAIRHPEVAAALAQHETRSRAALADLLADALAAVDRVPTIEVSDLVRLVVAACEGGDAQTLTEIAATGSARESVRARLVPLLLREYTRPVARTDPGSLDSQGDSL